METAPIPQHAAAVQPGAFPTTVSPDPYPRPPVETTGRYLMLFEREADEKKVMGRLKKATLKVASTSDFTATRVAPSDVLRDSDGIFFRRLGVAVLNAPPQQSQINTLMEGGNIQDGLIIEPERVVYAFHPLTAEYMQGYFDAVKYLYEKSRESTIVSEAAIASSIGATWGLQAIGALNSPYTGRGVKVAILDTGLYANHPDFSGRSIVDMSFIRGEEVNDLNGHGTHCIGTALGPKTSNLGVRYGVAYEGEIYAGKVLSNTGQGTDSDILDGIEWALSNECKIISMSLGARANPSRPNDFSPIFEEVAQRVLDQGTLIIAAAGNDSWRDRGQVNPVSHPANCPSIMAVGAVDKDMKVANFSNAGQVDIVAPGVDVYSAYKYPELTKSASGTSMAAPHVAGVAALCAQANPGANAYQIWQILTRNARRLPLPATDVGAGLVQVC